MSGPDTATVERHGDDLVIAVCAVFGGYDKFAIAAVSILVLSAIASLWWAPVPALVASCLLLAVLAVRMWRDLRWWISGSEEWRLAGTTLVYRLWYRDELKVRRELDLGQIDRLGARRCPRQSTRYEFAVVIAMADRLVGRGRLSPGAAAEINAALCDHLARPDVLHRASVFNG